MITCPRPRRRIWSRVVNTLRNIPESRHVLHQLTLSCLSILSRPSNKLPLLLLGPRAVASPNRGLPAAKLQRKLTCSSNSKLTHNASAVTIASPHRVLLLRVLFLEYHLASISLLCDVFRGRRHRRACLALPRSAPGDFVFLFRLNCIL